MEPLSVSHLPTKHKFLQWINLSPGYWLENTLGDIPSISSFVEVAHPPKQSVTHQKQERVIDNTKTKGIVAECRINQLLNQLLNQLFPTSSMSAPISQEIRRLFPFEVDPLEDMPFLAVTSAVRWEPFLRA